MSQYSDEELDKINGRMAEMEKNIAIVQENLYVLNEHEISKRITFWPYVAVDTSANR